MKLTRGSLVRRVARQMLAGMFISSGLEALRNPAPKVARAKRVTEPLTEVLGTRDLGRGIAQRVQPAADEHAREHLPGDPPYERTACDLHTEGVPIFRGP
jgi:hypothetical protein